MEYIGYPHYKIRTPKKSVQPSAQQMQMLQQQKFWGMIAIGATVLGFMAASVIMMLDTSTMLFRECSKASNTSAFLMSIFFFSFLLAGIMALGEGFRFFENKRGGISNKSGLLLWTVATTIILGSIALTMLKFTC